MTRTNLPTGNPSFGFYGTVTRAPERDATSDAIWNEACAAIWHTLPFTLGPIIATDTAAEAIRNFLDSRDGRHFADAVIGRLQTSPLCNTMSKAIIDTAHAWQAIPVSKQSCAATGIPQGTPFLEGMILHYAILADAAAEADDNEG